jgi:peptidylprolyl isomerase/FKBP-type peptidyl-prolyl cis-trans isomerase FklB
MAKNGTAKGVVTTPSGLEYFAVKSGPATGAHPTAQDTATFDYEVKLLNGTTIDSSYERGEPLTGRVGDFVPGFTEALELMRPGDEWIVWVPPQLGYGAKDSGPIPGNSVLRFRLALHSVTPAN